MTLKIKKFREGMMIFEQAILKNPPDFTDKATEDIWFEKLKHISNNDFIRAIDVLVQTSKYFPTISEIINASVPAHIASADQEWNDVIVQINRCCGAPGVMPELTSPITCRVIASMGGLNAIWLDHRDRSYLRQEFIRNYKRLVSSERVRLLSGIKTKQVERENVNKD